ncbi:sensor histidine kinase [Vibrio albus]|uniref:Sensor histidine kinase n=1 Tax=Vibrio albus TaxID=2200953 RepID=A0A2U3B6S7_9VIBR|nr:histidine kinase [Vibrio albus]PWI32487.1 sensor histidine kinase [Vibrio albus]
MSNSLINNRIQSVLPRARSFLITTVVCAVIAMFTRSLWPVSPYHEHLLISFGFGYSSLICEQGLSCFFPQLSSRVINIFSLSGAMLFGTLNAYYWLSEYEGLQSFSGMLPVIVLGLIFSSFCFFYFYSYEKNLIIQKELEITRRKQSEKEKELVLSQLKQLQSQIEPHFLFNTLANVTVLIDHDSEKAKLMLSRLTDLLRTTLTTNRKQLTSLEQEITMLSAYLDIQKIRLGARLDYQVECEEPLKKTMIPPLLLQPLVENAITHGIEPKCEGGVVRVNIYADDDWIWIKVIDNGRGFTFDNDRSGHGVALANIRNRLKALFSDQGQLTIKENLSGGVTASVQISYQGLEALAGIRE